MTRNPEVVLHAVSHPFPVLAIWDLVFGLDVPHTPADAVLCGHQDKTPVTIYRHELRTLVTQLCCSMAEQDIRPGRTVLLASFSSSNELSQAVIFCALACMGVRVFIPMYPEVGVFEDWHRLTGFSRVIMPWREASDTGNKPREQELVHQVQVFCRQRGIPLLDSDTDFNWSAVLKAVKQHQDLSAGFWPPMRPDPSAEAVIFTTSGTSGNSRLVAYSQAALLESCKAWQEAGLFEPDICGNPGFTPLFTHTIGIRSLLNALWTGQPLCLPVTDWMLTRPEAAAYLFSTMQPGHMVGGPAMFKALLELCRHIPSLKTALRNSLRTLISIGAPYDSDLAIRIRQALGIQVWNGYGTTETLMVMLNRPAASGPYNPESLGKPLPGVVMRLEASPEKGLYDLSFRSPFQATRIIHKPSAGSWHKTGDLVRRHPDTGVLTFEGRKQPDYFKDGFGVKIPLARLQAYYPELHRMCTHIEWIGLDRMPGLAALLFLPPEAGHEQKKYLSDLIRQRNEMLRSSRPLLEYDHSHLERWLILQHVLPRSRKGTISRSQILTQYADQLGLLANPNVQQAGIENLGMASDGDLHRFSNPRLADLLQALRLDVQYERAKGDYMYYRCRQGLRPVLDMVGGFGAGLLGHAHPAVRRTIRNFLDSGRPALNQQGSLYHYPALMARQLNHLFGEATGRLYKVLPANTGAEAVEMALHHAYYAWWKKLEKRRDEQLQLFGSEAGSRVAAIWELNLQRAAEAFPVVLAVNGCFHGYSSGARSLLNGKPQRSLFAGLLRVKPLHITPDDAAQPGQTEAWLQQHHIPLLVMVRRYGLPVVEEQPWSTLIASILEPVQGEGGIRETEAEIIPFLKGLNLPLISDEIQCGLGRTGKLPALSGADYYLLGKSLGGGVEKIAALLIEDRHFEQGFTAYYASTFANGELAAAAACTTLDIIRRENLVHQCREKGRYFLNRLSAVAEQYPDVLSGVAGSGLMLGIHFHPHQGRSSILMRALLDHEMAGYLFSGWLLHQRQLRMLPSLSAPAALRLEPSAFISEKDMNACISALEDLCRLCRQGNWYDLLRFLMDDDPYEDRSGPVPAGVFPREMEAPLPGAVQVGFVGNFTQPPAEWALIEPSLAEASSTGLRILFEKIQLLMEGKPIRLFGKNLMEGRVHFSFFILPFDTAHLEGVQRWGKKRWYIARVQEAVNRLAAHGAACIALGAHTSIISGNGLLLAPPAGTSLVTGNTLTVASCLYHVEQYLLQSNFYNRPPLVAIVGAHGNIGSGLAACFGQSRFRHIQLLLLGTQQKKLQQLAGNALRRHPSVRCSTDLNDLRDADVIISCTNTNDPIVFPQHLDAGREVFVVDIAVPGGVSDAVRQMPGVIFCREAASVHLPGHPDFLISTHTPAGQIFCCAAEGILAALYPMEDALLGHIRPEAVEAMTAVALREGMFQPTLYAPVI